MKLTITSFLICILCSCGYNRSISKIDKINLTYNTLISKELSDARGIDYGQIDSLNIEREREIKQYSKS